MLYPSINNINIDNSNRNCSNSIQKKTGKRISEEKITQPETFQLGLPK